MYKYPLNVSLYVCAHTNSHVQRNLLNILYLATHGDAAFMGNIDMPDGLGLALHVAMRYTRVKHQLLLTRPLKHRHTHTIHALEHM